MPDFDEANESIQLLNQHRHVLGAQGSELLAQAATAHPVGLILAPESTGARRFGEAVGGDVGREVAGKGFIGLVPWEFAVAILRPNTAVTLDRIQSAGVGSQRRLPLVAATKDGFRLGWVEYAVQGS